MERNDAKGQVWEMRSGYHPGCEKPGTEETQKEQGFYHKPVWRKLRRMALQRDHYLCQLRVSSKCTKIATEVHHIKSLEEFPELGLNIDNLTSCCWWCHEETKHKHKRVESASGVRVIHVSDGSETEDWMSSR